MNLLNYQFTDNSQPVLLLIHGFLGSMQQWDYLDKTFATHFSLLKIELPGHGTSKEFTESYNLEQLSLLVTQILEKEHIKQVHILGHSMGGYLGCAFAKANPKKTLSLTLLNSIAGEDLKERKLLRDRSIKLIEKHQEAYINMAISNLFNSQERLLFQERIDLMKTQAHNISIKSILQALICMRDRNSYLEDLKTLNLKIHYIYGSQDKIIDPNRVEKEVKFFDCKSSQINSGHMSLLTSIEYFRQILHFVE